MTELIQERRFFVPEVVQTSAMDCGPASLKALLEGFGISVSYGRLREACQTNVDGTSIDTMEDVANQLGLESEQIMVPLDHLLISSAGTLPAIVVIRLANGLTHFVVIWSLHGRFLQVMDPGTGRRWPTRQRFLQDVYVHTYPVPAEGWREWAGSNGFIEPLEQRLTEMRLQSEQIKSLIDSAAQDNSWRSLAALDASTRMVDSLVRGRGIERGLEATKVIDRFYVRGIEQARLAEEWHLEMSEEGKTIAQSLGMAIPPPYWSVQPLSDMVTPENPELVLHMRGAVLVRVVGTRKARLSSERKPLPVELDGEIQVFEEEEIAAPQPLSPELIAALEEKPVKPAQEMFNMLRQDGLFSPIMVVFALIMATAGVLIEATLLQGILAVGNMFSHFGQRTLAIGMFFAFFVLMAGLELPISTTVMRIGRRLETRMRIAFLEKLPKLSDRYFHSRLISDMTQRAHELRMLRTLPEMGVTFLRTFFQLIFTTIGIIWLDPISAPLSIIATSFFIFLTIATKPFLDERDLRARTHLGALDRFYLDSLLGLIPIRTHGAERAMRREHENLLVEWVHASLESLEIGRIIQAVSAVSYSIFAVWILFNFISQGGNTQGILLLFYWTLNLPSLGQNLVLLVQQYPMQRNSMLRVLEPLTAPDEDADFGETSSAGEDIQVEDNLADGALEPTHPQSANAVQIKFKDVSVVASGHTILEDVNLIIHAGEHVAIVGPSGAGKSSLVSLLLGWHRAASGKIWIDNEQLTGKRLRALRQEITWVDPAVQIWNRSLLENLLYGTHNRSAALIQDVIEQADLFEILSKLPDGMQTALGESGGLVSGGEGQRVRLGRAMLRKSARLVILDEPFRGLDREKRRKLLAMARQYWHSATLICVTHDVSETQTFERVLVIENGHVAEDDLPATLLENPDSRYRALMEAEEAVRVGLWASSGWRRLWLENGQLKETE
ncbi:MAG: ATP-binding cassette domain-containing protein [Chloroflexota bacterium]|jgi:ATP-binding cassette subfamily B protein